jgi:hypothetical protein
VGTAVSAESAELAKTLIEVLGNSLPDQQPAVLVPLTARRSTSACAPAAVRTP